MLQQSTAPSDIVIFFPSQLRDDDDSIESGSPQLCCFSTSSRQSTSSGPSGQPGSTRPTLNKVDIEFPSRPNSKATKMLQAVSSAGEQALAPQSQQAAMPHFTLPQHHGKRLRHAQSLAQRRIQRGRPSRTAGGANYGTPKAWQCGWDNHGAGPVCTKSFGRKSDLQRHHHTHTGTRNHACTFDGCGKTFIQTSALTVHMRTHTGEKPHECSVCSKRFSDSSSLARHRKIHSNERPYPCDVEFCDKSFCRKSTLHKHIERDHPHIAIARADEDGWYDEQTLSPINSTRAQAAPDMAWSASTDGLVSPFTTLPSQNYGPGRQQATHGQQMHQHQTHHQHQQGTVRSPFTSVRQRGTPDPTYIKYPYPNLSMGQVQNLSGGEVRGYHQNAMVNPPNLQRQDDQNSVSNSNMWTNDQGMVPSNMAMMHQRSLQDGYQEYNQRSTSLEDYTGRLTYDGSQISTAQGHRRSTPDGANGMPLSHGEYQMHHHHSADDAQTFDQQQQHGNNSFKPDSDTQQIHVLDAPSYAESPIDYAHVSQPEQHATAQAPVYKNEPYQEPQDLGVVVGQTYSIPIGYELGIDSIGFAEEKFLDNFGEQFPSQILP